MSHGPLVDPDTVPGWLRTLVASTGDIDVGLFTRFAAIGEGAREAAVLILLGEDEHHGPDVLLQLRAASGDAHANQVSFPGGKAEPEDDGPVATALREAVEETGVDPAGVRPVALLPALHIPVSAFDVTPVVAHWEKPSRVWAVSERETQAVARVPIAHLADPANRFRVRHPSGYVGPAFAAPDMLVWGFTAGLLTMVLAAGGWHREWDARDVRDLDVAWRSVRSRGPEVSA
ncbi:MULTISPECIES: NUDIX hydrolase [Actinokineospora]|uniref:Coenzyme A pyrophosphatase n=1 Tax=Actinokineospora fastidiosa TaxID=1816 RepID=A0A918G4P8_9PSEU|nr:MULTISPECIES: CoA pyrophosphatase [Actinokineospora]UVS76584.1 putative NUDIX hydrolase [Actinokineospora sp. UTMC 2448]GGS17211.1 coenzyme A pyrophosphatase [Actinokineospora fastidiosa]